MMIEPPIDKLVEKTNNNRYVLCTLIAKQAKHLEVTIPEQIEASDEKAISIAARQVNDGDVVPSNRA